MSGLAGLQSRWKISGLQVLLNNGFERFCDGSAHYGVIQPGDDVKQALDRIDGMTNRGRDIASAAPQVGLVVQSGLDPQPLIDVLRDAGLRDGGGPTPGSEATAPVLHVYRQVDGLDEATRWLREQPNTLLLLAYSAPIPTVAARIALNADMPPELAVTDWMEQVQPLLAAFRRARRRMVLVEYAAAVARPGPLVDVLGERLGLSLSAPAKSHAPDQSAEPADPVLRLIADRACQHDIRSRQFVAELEASAIPVNGAGKSSAIDLSSTLHAYRKQSGQPAEELTALKEENEVLQGQLQQARNNLEQVFQQKRDLDQKIKRLEDRLEKQQSESANNSELKEENELLLVQLHQVQEELESYFLDNRELNQELNKLRGENKALERKARRANNMLKDVHGSLSWKITAPLRWLLRPVLGK